MAPTAPSKRVSARTKARTRLTSSTSLPKPLPTSAHISDDFSNTKKDKRQIKHSSFVSRIATTTSSGISKSKRRRPNKKLVTTLESLGDALDDITAEIEEGKKGDMDAAQAAMGRVRHKSLKSRPGALKRKERVVKGEMERFGKSLAELSMVTGVQQQQIQTPAGGEGEGGGMEVEGKEKEKVLGEKEAARVNRWAALRGFISSTMEQNPAFLMKKE